MSPEHDGLPTALPLDELSDDDLDAVVGGLEDPIEPEGTPLPG